MKTIIHGYSLAILGNGEILSPSLNLPLRPKKHI